MQVAPILKTKRRERLDLYRFGIWNALSFRHTRKVLLILSTGSSNEFHKLRDYTQTPATRAFRSAAPKEIAILQHETLGPWKPASAKIPCTTSSLLLWRRYKRQTKRQTRMTDGDAWRQIRRKSPRWRRRCRMSASDSDVKGHDWSTKREAVQGGNIRWCWGRIKIRFLHARFVRSWFWRWDYLPRSLSSCSRDGEINLKSRGSPRFFGSLDQDHLFCKSPQQKNCYLIYY